MLTNQRATGSKTLRAAQTSCDELGELVRVVNRRRRLRELYRVGIRSGDVADGSALSELATSPDFPDVRSLHVEVVYGVDDCLAVDLIDGRPTLTWEGPIGADVARLFEYRWNEFPGRARVPYRVVSSAGRAVPALAAVFAGWWGWRHSGQIVHHPFSPIWPVLAPVAALVAAAAALWAVTRRDSAFVAPRARRRPFVLERGESVWRDERFVVTVALSGLATAAAVVSAIAAL